MAHRATTASDIFTEDQLRLFFEEAMEEEGIEPDSIETAHWTEDAFGNEKYAVIVTKRINGEQREFKFGIDLTAATSDLDRLGQEMATAAHNIAHQMEEAMVETIETCGTRLRFCAAEGGWVKCLDCGKRVSLTDTQSSVPMFVEGAELSNPSPSPYDIEDFLQRLDAGGREVLKLYLLGALREECTCEFGKRGLYDYW